MQVSVEKTKIPDLVIVQHEVFHDDRGFFQEVYREDEFHKVGLELNFMQSNHSGSSKNVVRGLHFQWDPPMGKMMRVTRGEAFLVAVDVRKGSPTLGRWHGELMKEYDGKQLYGPAGFARGFCVLSDYAEIQYMCTGAYNPQCEAGILWNDPEIGIQWPVAEPALSAKDQGAQTLSEWLSQPDSDQFTLE